jgi:RNA polymerase sigma-70 factor (ECF subfamily)
MDPPSELAHHRGEAVVRVPLSFEELFAAEHAKLFRALYLIVGNAAEAEELMQDAFLKVLERFDRIENPAGYLYRSAMNAARSRFRRLAMAARKTLPTGREPEDPFAAADLRDEVVRALRELPERQRAALVLTDMLDLSSEEASKSLGVTPATVRSLASHARAALKLTMEPADE